MQMSIYDIDEVNFVLINVIILVV